MDYYLGEEASILLKLRIVYAVKGVIRTDLLYWEFMSEIGLYISYISL